MRHFLQLLSSIGDGYPTSLHNSNPRSVKSHWEAEDLKQLEKHWQVLVYSVWQGNSYTVLELAQLNFLRSRTSGHRKFLAAWLRSDQSSSSTTGSTKAFSQVLRIWAKRHEWMVRVSLSKGSAPCVFRGFHPWLMGTITHRYPPLIVNHHHRLINQHNPLTSINHFYSLWNWTIIDQRWSSPLTIKTHWPSLPMIHHWFWSIISCDIMSLEPCLIITFHRYPSLIGNHHKVWAGISQRQPVLPIIFCFALSTMFTHQDFCSMIKTISAILSDMLAIKHRVATMMNQEMNHQLHVWC